MSIAFTITTVASGNATNVSVIHKMSPGLQAEVLYG